METRSSSLEIPVNGRQISGDLLFPEDAKGLVIFAHGSGSSRHSPRNHFVASFLFRSGLATLLVDLLSEDEKDEDRFTQAFRFNIRLLAERVAATVDWATSEPMVSHLPIGIFGSSTGAAAGLVAAAARPQVGALVSRGGRPDLAGDALRSVFAPTLFLVGERDLVVLELNREAISRLPGHGRLRIVPKAGHLFEEPGALETVAKEAADWFVHYLPISATQPARI